MSKLEARFFFTLGDVWCVEPGYLKPRTDPCGSFVKSLFGFSWSPITFCNVQRCERPPLRILKKNTRGISRKKSRFVCGNFGVSVNNTCVRSFVVTHKCMSRNESSVLSFIPHTETPTVS